MPDKLSEAVEESEGRSAKKRARIAAFRYIKRYLRAMDRIIALLETSVTSD